MEELHNEIQEDFKISDSQEVEKMILRSEQGDSQRLSEQTYNTVGQRSSRTVHLLSFGSDYYDDWLKILRVLLLLFSV